MSRISLFSAVLLVVLSLAIAVTPTWAQGGSGSISGRVTDVSGAVLQGAQVDLQPKAAASAVTNQQGEFTILNLPAGNYTVTVSYVGFAAFTKDVAVSAGAAARLDAVLGAASATQEVEVFAEREHGEAEAINRQFTSPNILQVLPVEVITSLPNTNIADALGRLPSVTLERDEGEGKYVQIRGLEPRLSNVTVNGVDVPSSEAGVRQIKLDSIPANLVESVEINKTLSANQDGDAIGGSVNLVTKTAGEKPTLYINGIGGYTPIDEGRTLTEMDSTIGQRFGAQKKFGVLFGASYDWNGRGIDDIENGLDAPSINGTFQPVITGIDLREYAYYRERLGFAGSADYKLADGGGLYVRGLYSHFNNFGDRWVYSPAPGTYTSPTDAGTGTVSYNASIRRPVEIIGSLAAGGKHVLSKSWLSYDLSISRSTEGDKGYSQADFAPTNSSPLATIPYTLDWTNPHTPKLIPASGINIFDTKQYYMADINVSHNFAAQLNLQGAIAAAHTYSVGGHFGIFELGFKIRNAHKFEDAAQDNYNTTFDPTSTSPDPALQLSGFQGSFRDSNYYDKIYSFGPTANYGKIRSFFNANRNNTSLFQIDQQGTLLNTISNSYNLVERITAGYAMNTLEFGRVRLQTGLRFEATGEDVKGNQVLLDSNGNLCGTAIPTRLAEGLARRLHHFAGHRLISIRFQASSSAMLWATTPPSALSMAAASPARTSATYRRFSTLMPAKIQWLPEIRTSKPRMPTTTICSMSRLCVHSA
jgi:TonB-dependent receptor